MADNTRLIAALAGSGGGALFVCMIVFCCASRRLGRLREEAAEKKAERAAVIHQKELEREAERSTDSEAGSLMGLKSTAGPRRGLPGPNLGRGSALPPPVPDWLPTGELMSAGDKELPPGEGMAALPLLDVAVGDGSMSGNKPALWERRLERSQASSAPTRALDANKQPQTAPKGAPRKAEAKRTGIEAPPPEPETQLIVQHGRYVLPSWMADEHTLGLTGADWSQWGSSFGLVLSPTMILHSVHPGSAAEAAGAGELLGRKLTHVCGQPVDNPRQLKRRLRMLAAEGGGSEPQLTFAEERRKEPGRNAALGLRDFANVYGVREGLRRWQLATAAVGSIPQSGSSSEESDFESSVSSTFAEQQQIQSPDVDPVWTDSVRRQMHPPPVLPVCPTAPVLRSASSRRLGRSQSERGLSRPRRVSRASLQHHHRRRTVGAALGTVSPRGADTLVDAALWRTLYPGAPLPARAPLRGDPAPRSADTVLRRDGSFDAFPLSVSLRPPAPPPPPQRLPLVAPPNPPPPLHIVSPIARGRLEKMLDLPAIVPPAARRIGTGFEGSKAASLQPPLSPSTKLRSSLARSNGSGAPTPMKVRLRSLPEQDDGLMEQTFTAMDGTVGTTIFSPESVPTAPGPPRHL
eukprot:Hpha_TRINITY_DN15781_c1_g3::TRINITY_DN15781_c1_g3_i1::g.40748::m.40748